MQGTEKNAGGTTGRGRRDGSWRARTGWRGWAASRPAQAAACGAGAVTFGDGIFPWLLGVLGRGRERDANQVLIGLVCLPYLGAGRAVPATAGAVGYHAAHGYRARAAVWLPARQRWGGWGAEGPGRAAQGRGRGAGAPLTTPSPPGC
jgi:hypothetical protein